MNIGVENPLARAAAVGAISGLRSLSGLALLAAGGRRSSWLPWRTRSTSPFPPWATAALGVLASAEMVADKLPWIPARTEPLPLLGRVGFGAVAGALAAGWGSRAPGRTAGAALLGAATAAAAAVTAYHLRRLASEELGAPDTLLGLAEDALILTVGRELVQEALA